MNKENKFNNKSENQSQNKLIPNLIKDTKTQPIVDYKECLFERVFVETPVDTDGDGMLDLIAVYIRRPKETLADCKVPAIYVANPYMMKCNEDLYVPYKVDKDLEVFEGQKIIEESKYDFDSVDEIICKQNHRETVEFAETAQVEEIPLDCITDWYSYFNSRGYASVFCGGLGTKGSQGITITGSREEILAFKAVIDWLNGRCRAFTNKTDNIEIKADWCTGNVAMSGKSYLGTMCIGVATTGVEGLKTIIPEAAISNWYAYDRYNGLNVPPLGWQGDDIALLAKYCCSRAMEEEDYSKIRNLYEKTIQDMEKAQDRLSGNYNKFWDERNYLNLASNIRASVFIVHGLNDWNVKMNQCIPLWEELVKMNIPRRMMLHQGEHIYINNLEGSRFNDILHSWLDYWLYDIENGVSETISEVFVQSNLNQKLWHKSENWGNRLAFGESCQGESLKFPILSTDIVSFTDDLALTNYDREKADLAEWRDGIVLCDYTGKTDCFGKAEAGDCEKSEVGDGGKSEADDCEKAEAGDCEKSETDDCGKSEVDDCEKSETGDCGKSEAESVHKYFLKYLWTPDCKIRISGTMHVTFEAAVDKSTAILSAMLVDYGGEQRLSIEQEVAIRGGIIWGKNTPIADEMRFCREAKPSAYKIISRGWMNAQNRSNNWSKETIEKGKFYKYEFDMVPMDYTVKKDHKIGLIIYGTDPEATERPFEATVITIAEGTIDATIPISHNF